MKSVMLHLNKEDKEKGEIRAPIEEEKGGRGRGRGMERVELKTKDMDTHKYIERKLEEKGLQRFDRHPADGLPLKHDPKKGHGGKYSWEGPLRDFENDLEPIPAAVDENDPNYVDDDDDFKDEEVSGGLVIGEVESAKGANEGVARIEVHPALEPQFNKAN